MRRLATLAFACAGCESAAVVPDAPPPDAFEGTMTVRIEVSLQDPPDFPVRDPKPTVYIEGVATESLTLTYSSARVAANTSIELQLRSGDAILARHRTAASYCADIDPTLTDTTAYWCAFFGSGELRMNGESGGGCAGDAWCKPRCDPWGNWFGCSQNPYGKRCASVYRSTEPIATELGCVKAGPRQLGETCGIVVDVTGAHDDCADGLLCVAGTCRRMCNPHATQQPDCSTACNYVLGHAHEIGICD